MNSLDGIMKIADSELGSIVNNGKFRSREEIESAEKLVKMAEKIYCIWDMMGGNEYSENYPYDDGMSYARGRGRNARRDSMGRYSSEGYSRGYSRNGGYSGGSYSMHGGNFYEEMQRMMEEAPDEQTRQNIQRMLDQMGSQRSR